MEANKYTPKTLLFLSACILSVLGLKFLSIKEGDSSYNIIIKNREYKEHIDSVYNSILQEDLKDTTYIDLLNKYTPLKEKKRIVNENKLEKNLGKEILIDSE